MQKKFVLVALLIALPILILVPLVFASTPFSDAANKFFQRQCSRPERTIGIIAFLCDLRLRVDELEGQVGGLETSTATMSAAIADLQQRVAALENPPQPVTIVFAENRPASFNTDFVPIPPGFKSMTLNVTTTGFLVNWAMDVNIGGTIIQQQRFRCIDSVTCPPVTLPIIANLYRFGTGTSSGNITAIATLNPEPNSQTLLLGFDVSLPFTSNTFNTNGFSSIIISVGQRGPTERLVAISLQRFEGGSFVEKQRVNCDGGAECPFTNLPLLGGDYRVVIEGSGGGAVVGALLRP